MKQLGLFIVFFILSSSSALSEEHIIDQKGLKFSLNEITISVGDKIRFTNSDRTAHHLMAKEGEIQVNSPLLPPKEEYVLDFPIAGTFTIGCHIHPKMNLVITVE